MVARLVRDQEARSSNLRTPTKRTAEGFSLCRSFHPVSDLWFAGLLSNQAQLGSGKAALRRRGRIQQRRFFRSRAVLRAEALRRGTQTALAARRGEAKRPGVQISALRPRRSSLRTARKQRLRKQSLFSHLCCVAPSFKTGPAALGSGFVFWGHAAFFVLRQGGEARSILLAASKEQTSPPEIRRACTLTAASQAAP